MLARLHFHPSEETKSALSGLCTESSRSVLARTHQGLLSQRKISQPLGLMAALQSPHRPRASESVRWRSGIKNRVGFHDPSCRFVEIIPNVSFFWWKSSWCKQNPSLHSAVCPFPVTVATWLSHILASMERDVPLFTYDVLLLKCLSLFCQPIHNRSTWSHDFH